MKKLNNCLWLLAVMVLSLGWTASRANDNNLFPHEKGKVIFKVKAAFRASCTNRSVEVSAFKKAIPSNFNFEVAKKFPSHQPPSTTFNLRGEKLVDISLIYEGTFNESIPVSKLIAALKATGTVEYAEPVYKMDLVYNPSDTATGSQYYLTLIQAFDAWDITQGDTNLVVGVTDTGADMDHPDLAAGIKYNYNDPIDGVDNDSDGYIDNFAGWDVGQNDNDPNVDVVHGSFVCGLAGAVTDNVTGIAGTGFKTRFLPVKISNNGVLTAAYDGIVYAATMDVRSSIVRGVDLAVDNLVRIL